MTRSHPKSPSSSDTWATRLILAAAIAGHVVLVWSARIPGVLTGQDDSMYILLARAISHGSYRELWRIDAPIHSQYPPGYPALLALWEAVAGPSQTTRIVLSIIASVAMLLLLHRVLRRRFGASVAVASVIVLAVNPFVIQYAGEVASELPYMLLSVACLYGLIRWEDERERGHTGASNAWLVGAAAAMIAAALVRTIGVALIMSVVVYLVLNQRWKAAAAVGLAGAATFGAWLFWTVLAPEQFVGRSYVADLLTSPERSFLMTIVVRIVNHARRYTVGVPWTVAVPTIQGTIADNIVGLLIVGITLLTGFCILWRQWRAAALYPATYGAVLLVYSWNLTRFLVPLLVLMVPCILLGAVSIVRSFRPRWANATLVVFVLLLVGGSAPRVAALFARNNCPRTEGIPLSPCAWWPEQARYFDALRFIRAGLPRDAVILTAKSGAMYYYTDHKSISFEGARAQHPDDFVAWTKTQGATHILLTSLADSEERLLPSLRANCDRLRLVASYTRTTLLLAIDPSADDASSGTDVEAQTCDAIEAFAGGLGESLRSHEGDL